MKTHQTLIGVPLTTAQTTTVSGSGDVAAWTGFTVTGLPPSAVAVAIKIDFSPGAVSNAVEIASSSTTPVIMAVVQNQTTSASGYHIYGHAVGACTPGSTNQLFYQISGSSGAAWSFVVTLTGYWEAA